MGNKEFLIATCIAQVVFLAAVVVLILFLTELIPLEGMPRYEVAKYCSISIGSLFGLSIAVLLYTLHRIFTESPEIDLKRYEPSTILGTLESLLESGVEVETQDEPQTSRALPFVTFEPETSRTLPSVAIDAPQTSRTLPSVSEEAKDAPRTTHTLSGYRLVRKTLRDMNPEVKKMKVNVQALAHHPSTRRRSFTESVQELLSAVGRPESGGIFHISIDTQDDDGEELGGQDETYVVGAGGQDETSSGAADQGELSAGRDEAFRTTSGRDEASRTTSGRDEASRTTSGRDEASRTTSGRDEASGTTSGRDEASRTTSGRDEASRTASGLGETSDECEKSKAADTHSAALSSTLGLRRRIATSFRKALDFGKS